MYLVLFYRQQAIPMRRDELNKYALTGHEAVHYFSTMEEAKELANILNNE